MSVISGYDSSNSCVTTTNLIDAPIRTLRTQTTNKTLYFLCLVSVSPVTPDETRQQVRTSSTATKLSLLHRKRSNPPIPISSGLFNPRLSMEAVPLLTYLSSIIFYGLHIFNFPLLTLLNARYQNQKVFPLDPVGDLVSCPYSHVQSLNPLTDITSPTRFFSWEYETTLSGLSCRTVTTGWHIESTTTIP